MNQIIPEKERTKIIMRKVKVQKPLNEIIDRANHILEIREMEGKEQIRFSAKYEKITDYLKSEEFKNSKVPFQNRVLKQAQENPQWDLADARGHSKPTGKTMQVFDENGVIQGGVQLKSRKEEHFYGQYLNDLKKYLKTGNDDYLKKWRDKTLRDANGNKLPFVTDKDVIDDLAHFSQLPSGSDIYIS